MTIRLLIGSLFLVAQTLVHADPTNAEVKSVKGDAYVIAPNGQSEKITNQTVIAPGSVIHTDSGTVAVHLMPGANTVIAPGSDVKISTLDYSKDSSGDASRKVVLDLRKGTVFNSLVHGDGVSDFRIKTPKGVAAARGTVWSVSTDGKNVDCKVARGVVVFTTIITHVVSVIPSGHGYSTITVKVYVLTEVEINHILVILNEFSFIFTIRVQNPGTTTSPEQ